MRLSPRTVGVVVSLLISTVSVIAQDPIRVLVSDGESWEMGGGFAALTGDDFAAGNFIFGARPQQVEMMKTMGDRCEAVTVTARLERADYVLIIERESGKGVAMKDNKWVLLTREGDMVDGGSTRALGNAAKDACKVFLKHAQR